MNGNIFGNFVVTFFFVFLGMMVFSYSHSKYKKNDFSSAKKFGWYAVIIWVIGGFFGPYGFINWLFAFIFGLIVFSMKSEESENKV
jgi:uncharacterized membrane protein YfcA